MMVFSSMVRKVSAFTLSSFMLVACGSQPNDVSGGLSADAALCRDVQSLARTAQRDSFSFNFSQADQKFTKLSILYDSEDVTSKCPDAPSEALLFASQGLALSNQEQYRLAETAFDQAQESLDAQSERRIDERLLLESFRVQDALNRGSISEHEKAFAELTTLLREAERASVEGVTGNELFAPDAATLRRQIGTASSEYVRAISLSSSFSNLEEIRLEQAEAAVDRAINAIGRVPTASAAYLPRFLIQKAAIQLERGKPDQAVVNSRDAAQSLLELLPGTPLGARALLVQAKAEAELGEVETALDTYAQAFSLYEENPVPIRTSSIWPYYRLALLELEKSPDRAEELHAKMFRAAQIVRTSIAAKTISGAAALFSEGETEAAQAVRDWQVANDRYGSIKTVQVQAQLDPLAIPEVKAAIQREVVQALADLEEALVRRDRVAPEYQETLDAPISLADLQAVLKPREAMVQILTGDPRNIILLIESDSIRIFTIPVNEGVVKQTVAIMRTFVEPNKENQFIEFSAEASHLAFQLLFGDAGPELLGFDKLVFSVSGPLSGLPLELLVVEEPDPLEAQARASGDYTGVAWLGRRADISYVPSVRNLVDIRSKAGSSAADKPIVAFGDFVAGADEDQFLERYSLGEKCRGDAAVVSQLEPLPETADEVRAIATALGAPDSIHLGQDFTQDAFNSVSGQLSDYRIVHFATHGLLWPTPDCFSEPALAVSVDQSGVGDPLLTASEIRLLQMDAQLVVLSACETAGPEQRGGIGAGGDSLSGLARAFFAAGARAVIASHWSVFSEQTQELTVAMYQEIGGDDLHFAAALRRAQEKMRSNPETSHPIYWAAFVVIGDGSLNLSGS